MENRCGGRSASPPISVSATDRPASALNIGSAIHSLKQTRGNEIPVQLRWAAQDLNFVTLAPHAQSGKFEKLRLSALVRVLAHLKTRQAPTRTLTGRTPTSLSTDLVLPQYTPLRTAAHGLEVLTRAPLTGAVGISPLPRSLRTASAIGSNAVPWHCHRARRSAGRRGTRPDPSGPQGQGEGRLT